MTESTEMRGFEDMAQASAQETVGKGTESVVVFCVFFPLSQQKLLMVGNREDSY